MGCVLSRTQGGQPCSSVQRPDGLIAGIVVAVAVASAPLAQGQEWLANAPVPGLIVVHVHEQERGLEVAAWLEQFDLSHPDFDGRLATGNSCTCPRGTPTPWSCCVGNPCSYGPPEDNLGHGTPVAGVLGANADNGTPSSVTEEQYAGVDPSCTIVPFRIAWDSSHPQSITLLALQDILAWPIAHVVNMSYDFGPVEPTPGQTYLDLRNTLDQLKDANCIVVNISGVGSTGYADTRVPQAWNNTISVGATDNQDGLYGASATGNSVDFSAPGWGLYTVWCPESSGGCIAGWEASQYNCGTSGASPIVAGVVSLLLAYADELNVTLDWDDVYNALKAGAEPLGSGLPNAQFGWGRVNAYETLRSIE